MTDGAAAAGDAEAAEGEAGEQAGEAAEGQGLSGEQGESGIESGEKSIPDNPSVTGHIFRPAEGHYETDTPENRADIESAANNPENKKETDEHGTDHYESENADGSTTWAFVRGNNIVDGGRNPPPPK
jgi:hypothetical protein